MIFTDTLNQETFKKPRLGQDNLFYTRGGEVTGFGRVAAGGLSMLGAAVGGQKGAQFGNNLFGAIASTRQSNTADQFIQDNYRQNTDRVMSQALAPATIYGGMVDTLRDVGMAVATGGATAPQALGNISRRFDNITNATQASRQSTGPSQFRGQQSMFPQRNGYMERANMLSLDLPKIF